MNVKNHILLTSPCIKFLLVLLKIANMVRRFLLKNLGKIAYLVSHKKIANLVACLYFYEVELT